MLGECPTHFVPQLALLGICQLGRAHGGESVPHFSREGEVRRAELARGEVPFDFVVLSGREPPI
jgi:hypothetical protein